METSCDVSSGDSGSIKKKSRKKQDLGEIVMHDFFYVTESAS